MFVKKKNHYNFLARSTSDEQAVFMAVAVFVPFNSYVSGVPFCVGSAVLAGEYYRCFTILKGNYPYEDKAIRGSILLVCLRIQVKKTRNSRWRRKTLTIFFGVVTLLGLYGLVL